MSGKPDQNARFSDEMLLMTARLYYVDGLPQADVARVMHVSQPQVSRLLSLARERGIVRITVDDYDPRDHELEQVLVRRLGLKSAVVIKTVRGSRPADLRYTVAHFGAADVARNLSNASTVAIAGGRTLQDLVQQLKKPEQGTGLVVVQAMGNVGSVPSPYDGLELGRLLASKWNGSFFMLNTPVLLPDVRTRDAIMNLGENQQVNKRFSKCDFALVGIGTLNNSVLTERSVLGEKDLRSLVRAGVVGEICGHYYDAKGMECDTAFRDRVASISIEQLRKIPNVMGVTIGPDRAEALAAAINGGMVNSVLIDDLGAQALLEKHAATNGKNVKVAV